MTQKIHGDLEVTGSMTNDGDPVTSFKTVATNAAKLALTGLVGGEIYHISDEANRIEQYVSGDIDDDASWAVLRNTIHLYVYSSYVTDTVALDGQFLSTQNTVVEYGWIKDAETYTLAQPSAGSCYGGTKAFIRKINSVDLIGTLEPFNPTKMGASSYSATHLALPGYPGRSVVEISV